MITRSLIVAALMSSTIITAQNACQAQSTRDAGVPAKQSAPLTTKQVQTEASKDAVRDALAQVDGVPINKETKPEKSGFTIGDLNPFKYIFKPVTDVRKEVKNLSKQVNDFNTPLTNMQKPMVGLRQDMVDVQDNMQTIHADIRGVHRGMGHVQDHLSRIDRSLTRIAEPVGELAAPVIRLQKPVKAVDGQLKSLKSDLHEMKDTVGYTTTAIFIAILAMGALVVVGAPIAGIFVYRHRNTIMRKFGEKKPVDPQTEREEAKIS